MRARPWASILVVGVGAVLLAIHLAFVVAEAHRELTSFAVLAFDGAMQHLNPLYRLADGQRPGADFPVFQGPGLPVLHYPLFALFGGDFFGAELSRRISAGLAGSVGPLVLVCALARRRRTIAVAALALTPALYWPWLRELALPGPSLLGVRAAAPLVMVALLYWLSTSQRPRVQAIRGGRWLEVIAGLAAVVAFLLGTEQGLGLLVGLLVAVLVTEARGTTLRARIRSAATLGVAFVIGLLVLGGAIMGSGLFDGLRYAFVDVPADQGWYFGAPPNPSVVDLRPLLGTNLWAIVTLALLAPVGVWLLRRLDPGSWVILALSVYGVFTMISLLGYAKYINLTVAARVLVLLVVWLLVAIAPGRLPARFGAVRTSALLAGLWLALTVVPVLGEVQRAAGGVRAEIADPPTSQGRYAGVGLSREWAGHARTLDALARTECRTLWSTFGGVAEAERGKQNPTGFDYLIHTVGSRREPYLEAFDRAPPECFSTSRRTKLLGYEEWLWNANWDLYRRVLDGYRPKVATPFSLVWERAPTPQLEEVARVSTGPVPSGQALALPPTNPARPTTMYVVRVRYRARRPLAAVPVIGTLPRFGVFKEQTRDGPDVYLPPDRTSWEFPVFVAAGAQAKLRFGARSVLPGAGLDVEGVTVRTVELPPETMAFWLETPGGPSSPDPTLGPSSGF